MSLLEIQQLSTSFRGTVGETDVHAVRDVSIVVERGETVAIVGESGSGKSQTALSVMQLLAYPRAYHSGGSIRLAGDELLGAPEPILQALRGDRMSMIFQEPMTSLNPLHTVEKQIGETLRLHQGLEQAAARQRCLELLERVHIAEPEQRLSSWPHQLSGGQRQRVMIAMALANQPDLLIADEPTTALDVTVQAEILTLLRQQQRSLDMGLLLITHDMTLVQHIADRVYVMTEGRVVESGLATQVLTAPTHSYTQQLLASEPPPRWDRAARDAPTEVEHKIQADSKNREPLLVVDDLRVWFPIKHGWLRRTVGHVKAVDGVSFELKPGATIGLVGESGSG
ncbi:MAG TPA: microcin ABC transporter ATP-binding protein, partial [Candidatus Latescibacteria bacterium]|nr:microcin ABC transporter ATP-binding protein [Candidatus Latescibacterota bacterium]